MKGSRGLNRSLLIAGNTLREAVRLKLFHGLLLLGAMLVLGARYFREVNFGATELKFILDFGLGALGIFGSILAIVGAAQLFCGELESQTALTLLAKPVGRGEFMGGKFLGIFAVLGIFCALLTALLAGVLWGRETELMARLPGTFARGRAVHYGALAVFGALQWLKFGVLAALTLFIASWARSGLFSMMMGFAGLFICHLRHLARDAYAGGAAWPVRGLARLLGALFPDFQVFSVPGLMAGEATFDAGLAVRAGLYAAVYIAVFNLLAMGSFRSREL